MPEETPDISPEELQMLTAEKLHELRRKYGVELHFHASSAAVRKLAEEIGGAVDITRADFDRGYDRTQGGGGYDRFYDRDRGEITAFSPEDIVSRVEEEIRRRQS